MDVRTLPRRRPIPTLSTAAFAIALAATATYYAGLVPGVPKTLPTFVGLVTVTVVLLAAAAATWVVSFATG